MNLDLRSKLAPMLGLAAASLEPWASSPRWRPRDRDGIPVAPGWVPGLGHLPALMKLLPWVLREGDKLGPLFWLQIAPGVWQIFSAREEAMEVFRNKVTTSAHLAALAPVLVGRSLIGVDGDPHRRMRGALNGPFTPKGLTASRAGELMRAVIEPRVGAWAVDRPVRIANETREFAVDVIFRMMGIPSRDLVQWREAFETFTLTGLPLQADFPGSPMRRGLGARRWIDERLVEIVNDARTRSPDESMVAAMVHGRDEQGRGLDDTELIDNLRLLVFAGHETTASTMAWAVLHLARDPASWDRLVEESLALDGPPTSPDALARSPFAEAVFRESLRLHPPVSLDSRESTEAWECFGRPIPKKMVVGVGIHHMSRNPDRYPDPDAFVPTRWLKRERRPTPIETAQFGGGPHFCLGYHVAWMEAVQFLVTVARRFGASSRRPTSDGAPLPHPIYMPLQRPPPSAVVRFVRA